MNPRAFLRLFSVLVVASFAWPAAADVLSFDATGFGWVNSKGASTANTYFVGGLLGSFEVVEYRDRFAFDLSTLNAPVVSGTLTLTRGTWFNTISEPGCVLCPGPPWVFGLFSSFGPSFGDLGSGLNYGTYQMDQVQTTNDGPRSVVLPLNQNAINALNASRQGAFMMSGRIMNIPSSTLEYFLFDNTPVPTVRLDLVAVPEPSSLIFLLTTLGLIALKTWRRLFFLPAPTITSTRSIR